MTASPPEEHTSRRPRALLWAGVGMVSVVGVLAVLIALDPAQPFSYRLDLWWARTFGNGNQFGYPAVYFESLGGVAAFVNAVVVVVVLLRMRRRWAAMFAASALAAGPFIVEIILKPLVLRPRPYEQLDWLTHPAGVNAHSFPSGHCTTATALAIVLVAVTPRAWRRWMWALAGLIVVGIVWQRTMCNAHWFTDAVAGVLTGGGAALICWYAYYPRLTWRRGPASAAGVGCTNAQPDAGAQAA